MIDTDETEFCNFLPLVCLNYMYSTGENFIVKHRVEKTEAEAEAEAAEQKETNGFGGLGWRAGRREKGDRQRSWGGF